MKYNFNKIIYEFEIEAVSPIFFGGSNKGNLVKDSKGNPILFGNSIGGALRNYLKLLEVSEDTILKYLGGHKGKDFIESSIYISDGSIKQYDKVYCKEGTKINPKYGSAEKNHKYTMEYLPPKTVITFEIECEVQDEYDEETFNKIIGTWEKGFKDRAIKLGGQQNNGFGEFKLNQLKYKKFVFKTMGELDRYIFSLDEVEAEPVKNLKYYDNHNKKQISFSLSGKFPYGVYQSFTDNEKLEQTGLQKFKDEYYLPATSLKGVVKNEIRILLSRFIEDENIISKRLNEIFGEKERNGKIIFSDVILINAKPVETKRFKYKESEELQKPEKSKKVECFWEEPSIYIKVDRLTGGAFDGAMKKQREVCGDAVLNCILTDFEHDIEQKENPYIFPLIYVFKRIGEGLVPLGGRTSIGLGQFSGTKIEILGAVEDLIMLNELNKEKINTIKKYYDSFKRWCQQ